MDWWMYVLIALAVVYLYSAFNLGQYLPKIGG